MDATQLLLLSIALFGIGAVGSLLLNSFGKSARLAAGLAGVFGAAAGCAAAIRAVLGPTASLTLSTGLPFGDLNLRMDGLSTLMVGTISLVSFAVSLYSISYGGHEPARNVGSQGFFTDLFIGTMLLVVTTWNAFYFLLFWEMMTLLSYFLITLNDRKPGAVQAGFLYMLVGQAGGALILIALLVFYMSAGSLDFAAFRQAQLSPAIRSLIFLLAFIGFGAKAGMVPLHFWMPSAYAAAPSNASALMASVMKKTAIYGIVRFCVDLLGVPPLWWGLLVLLLGTVSVVYGVLFALAERDLKRLLAYSSVENVGIILLGLGTGMIGLATAQPVVAVLGFLAALYHALNHSLFKGLLFLGAGVVEDQLHTSNLNTLGGLAKHMPWTALAFLIGILAVSAMPPFNGFVSEWLTFQALFTASLREEFVVRALLPLCAAVLALAGTLAAMVAVKSYAGVFAGPSHAEPGKANEPPGTMLVGMGILAVGCLALGLGAPVVTGYLSRVVTETLQLPITQASSGTWIYPVDPGQALLSMPFVAILLAGLLVIPVVLVTAYGGRKAGGRVVKDPWACGYGYSIQMSVSASSFDQPVLATFSAAYLLRSGFQKSLNAIGAWSSKPRDAITRAEPVLETAVKEPTTRAIDYLARHIQALQMGDIRVYCFYIIITLAILLIVIFR